jgi:PAS domain S-box-containing protein/putative nucleotidyltransferase with HDIG domain
MKTEIVESNVEDRFRIITENLDEGLTISKRGKISYVNGQACYIFGYPEAELKKLSLYHLAAPSERPRLELTRKLAEKTGNPVKELDFWITRKDGSSRFIHNRFVYINGINKTQDWLMVTRDITAEKNKSQQLIKPDKEITLSDGDDEYAKYKAIFESMDSIILVLEKNGEVIDANRRFTEISGYQKDVIVGQNISALKSIIRSESLAIVLESFRKKMEGADLLPYEVQVTNKNGEDMLFEISSRPLKRNGDIIGDLVVLKDITERKKIQQSLSESEYKFRILAEESPNLIFIVKRGSLVYVNRKFVEITEYKYKQLCSPDFDFLQLIKSDSRDRIKNLFKNYSNNGKSKVIECVFETRSGKEIEVILVSKLIAYEHEPAILGVITDVSQLKAAEKLSRAILDSPTIGMYIVQKGKFRLMNPAFRNLADRSEDELMSMDPREIIFDEDRNMVRENAIKMLKGTRTSPYEFRYVRKNGEIRWVSERLVSILYEGQRATLGSFMDITERKQIESEIKTSYKRLQRTMEGAIEAIASISETRDPYTAGHQRRVAKLASTIAREMELSEEQIAKIRIAGLLHDIGKVAIPAELLSKPGKLNETEFNLIKTHPKAGREILKTMELPWVICPIVYQHHERLDGSGYPRGLSGNAISIEARIIAVADVVEAMASHRPYRPSLGIDVALEEISKNKGKLYDIKVADTCLKLFRKKGFKFEDDAPNSNTSAT